MTAVKELMDTRGAETGDRPKVYILDYVTNGLHVGLAPLGMLVSSASVCSANVAF